MIKDTYVNMLINERNKLDISTVTLCEGVYNEDMFYRVEKGERTMDRVTVKRLLARLGVENGDYEHFLDYPDYEMWKKRMDIINYIEEGNITLAEKLIEKYLSREGKERKRSREKIESQFCMFMKMQTMRYRDNDGNKETYEKLCEETLKLTVPYADDKPINRMLLSPLEYSLVLEYKSIKNSYKTIKEYVQMYEEFLKYIDNAPYGKVLRAKLYPKTVVYMYISIVNILKQSEVENKQEIYLILFRYSKQALQLLKERKLLFYIVEILEMQSDILKWFLDNIVDTKRINEYQKEREEIVSQLKEIKDIYIAYGEEPYMKTDCYLYRESGIYCANDIIRIRRRMFNLSQEKLSDDDVSVGTIKRVENKKRPMTKETLQIIFSKLNLFPNCVNLGIVTDRKEAVELFEELRYAIVSLQDDNAKKIVSELKQMLCKHPINEQVLTRLESLSKWRAGEITEEQHIEELMQALSYTVELSVIQNAEKIFITTEELETLYMISATHKQMGRYDEALYYIKEIWRYCQDIENEGLADGRMGIYELIMEYMGSLYGDIGRYEESNNISNELIKKCLRLRRGNQIHTNIYNIAWNNNESKKSDFDYKKELRRCICLSQLIGDTNYTMFYNKKLNAML